MSNSNNILKLASKNSNSNYSYYLNKKISNISIDDVKLIKKNYLNQKNHFLIIKGFGKTSKTINNAVKSFSKKFGKVLSQDKYGSKFIEVAPDVKKIHKQTSKKKIKLRYHQTNTGGFIHSDGPQLTNPPKYVLMACVNKAKNGGFSILSSIDKIVTDLKKNDKKTLSTLKKNFLFERRGFYKKNNSRILSKPILEIYNTDFRFRYLRNYMNEAYKIKSIKLSKIKIRALDKLDKLLSKKKNQNIFKLEKGDALLLNNYKLAHGRSAFDLTSSSNRSLIRVWFR